MVMADKQEHGMIDVWRISGGHKTLGWKTMQLFYTRLFSPRFIHSSSRHIDAMRFIRLLHCAITLLPILHMVLPNGLTPPLFMPL